MNLQIAQQWVEALRSGKYKQTFNRLKHEANYFNGTPTYCCLGVLCDLSAKEKVGSWQKESGYLVFQCNPLDCSISKLPHTVRKWAGINSFKEISRLINMNDEGKSFQQIANYIEVNQDRI